MVYTTGRARDNIWSFLHNPCYVSESDIVTALTLVVSLREKNATKLEQIRKSKDLSDKAAAAKAGQTAANQAKRGKALGKALSKDDESKDDSNHPDDDDDDDTRGAGSAPLNVELQGSKEEREDEEYGNIETVLRVAMAAEAKRHPFVFDRATLP